MKTSCESAKAGVTEVIQGIQTEERDVTRSMAMPQMPGINMKLVMRVWTTSQTERLRASGLWSSRDMRYGKTTLLHESGRNVQQSGAAGCTPASFGEVMNGIMQDAVQAMATPAAKTRKAS